MKYRELRLLNAVWGTTCYSQSYKHAILQFLTNPIYNFKPGKHSIQFRNGKVYNVILQETKTDIEIIRS
jgi:hypothetical protein